MLQHRRTCRTVLRQLNIPCLMTQRQAIVTDPPYYDAVPYAYLSDFLLLYGLAAYTSPDTSLLLRDRVVPKEAEIVVDRPHQLSQVLKKGIDFYERELGRAFGEHDESCDRRNWRYRLCKQDDCELGSDLAGRCRRWLDHTGSWPIDTEMGNRVSRKAKPGLLPPSILSAAPERIPTAQCGNE